MYVCVGVCVCVCRGRETTPASRSVRDSPSCAQAEAPRSLGEPSRTIAGSFVPKVLAAFFSVYLHSVFDDFRKEIHVILTAGEREMEGIIPHSNSINT